MLEGRGKYYNVFLMSVKMSGKRREGLIFNAINKMKRKGLMTQSLHDKFNKLSAHFTGERHKHISQVKDEE